MEEVAKLAATLSKMDCDLILHGYPQSEGRGWLTPARFYQYKIATIKRRYWFFGPWDTVLTRQGKALRAYLAGNIK